MTRTSGIAGHDVVDQLVSLPPAPRRCGTPRNWSASPSASACAARRSACRRWRGGTGRGGPARVRRNPSAARGCLSFGLDQFGAAQRRGAAEHHEIDQRVRAEPVGAMHRDAGGLAERHQAGHDVIGIAVLLGQRPRRDSSWRCRPCCNARSAAPGSARGSHRRRRRCARFRKCRAAARAAPRDRDDRGAGRCDPCCLPTPRPSRISMVIERETTSREARSLADGA